MGKGVSHSNAGAGDTIMIYHSLIGKPAIREDNQGPRSMKHLIITYNSLVIKCKKGQKKECVAQVASVLLTIALGAVITVLLVKR